jgi:hypothetical protein
MNIDLAIMLQHPTILFNFSGYPATLGIGIVLIME